MFHTPLPVLSPVVFTLLLSKMSSTPLALCLYPRVIGKWTYRFNGPYPQSHNHVSFLSLHRHLETVTDLLLSIEVVSLRCDPC